VDPGGNILRMLASKPENAQETDDSGVDYRYYEVHIPWPKLLTPLKPPKKEKKR